MSDPAQRLARPLFVRVWHWCTAVLFVLLAATGLKLHFSVQLPDFVSYRLATDLHNAGGILLALCCGLHLVRACVSGYWRCYVPAPHGLPTRLLAQLRRYTIDQGRRANAPQDQCFNALQQVAYSVVVFCLLPLLAVSGLLFLLLLQLPGAVPAFGSVALRCVALVHFVVGMLAVAYLLVHVYMACSEPGACARFRSMIAGSATADASKPRPSRRRH